METNTTTRYSIRGKYYEKEPIQRCNLFAESVERKKNIEKDEEEDDWKGKKCNLVVIHYTHKKILWDWLVLTLTAYTAVVVPLTAAFQLSPRRLPWLVFDCFLDMFFLLDIVVNFHTSFIGNQGMLVTNLKDIRIRYAKTWFAVDALSCLPYDAITMAIGTVAEKSLASLLSTLKACRLLRIIRIARDLDRYLEHAWASLLVMLCLMLLICHWMACGWFMVSLQGVNNYLSTLSERQHNLLSNEINNLSYSMDLELHNKFIFLENYQYFKTITGSENTSLFSAPEKQEKRGIENHKDGFPPKTWLITLGESTNQHYYFNTSSKSVAGGPTFPQLYSACLYFALTNVISAGFGNIAGETILEKIYCIFILTVGGILYAAILGNVTTILQQFNAHKHEFIGHLKAVRDFARINELPSHLTESICDYMIYTQAATHGIDVEKILNFLPDHKKAEVCSYLHRVTLKEQNVFKNMSHNEKSLLARNLERSYAAPGDIVCDKGEIVDHLYFVISGSLEIIYDDALVAIISKGDCFGLQLSSKYITHFEKHKSGSTVRALTYVEMDVISIGCLHSTMEKFPSIDKAFRTRLHLTYDLQQKLVFQTLEAVHWKRFAETPCGAKRIFLLKRWIQKKRNKNTEDVKKPFHSQPENITYTKTSLSVSTWKKTLLMLRGTRRLGKNICKEICSDTRPKKDTSFKKVKKGKHGVQSDIDIKCVRCKECGKTIGDDETIRRSDKEENIFKSCSEYLVDKQNNFNIPEPTFDNTNSQQTNSVLFTRNVEPISEIMENNISNVNQSPGYKRILTCAFVLNNEATKEIISTINVISNCEILLKNISAFIKEKQI